MLLPGPKSFATGSKELKKDPFHFIAAKCVNAHFSTFCAKMVGIVLVLVKWFRASTFSVNGILKDFFRFEIISNASSNLITHHKV